MSPSITGGTAAYLPANRLVRLDVLRLATLACIVAYHCLGAVTAASVRSGEGLWGDADGAAWLLSVFQNEVLIALSAFLFAWRRRDLSRTLTWLLEVYLFWTAVYVLELLVFPTHSSMFPFGRAKIVFVAFLGGAKYHLPFFPALAGCLTFIAVMPSLGPPRLWGGIAVAVAYVRFAVEQSVFSAGSIGPEQMLLFQGMAFVSYLPFAVLGAQIDPGSARGWTLRSSLDPLGFAFAAGVLIAEGLRQASADLPTATGALMAGRVAAIVAVLFLSLGQGTRWTVPSPGLRLTLARLAELSLAVFLVHPLVIDILARSLFLHAPRGTRVVLLFIGVLAISLAFASIAREASRITGWRRSRARNGSDRLF